MADKADVMPGRDRNQDRYIPDAEADAEAVLADRFARFEANGDGLPDANELAARRAGDDNSAN